MSVVCKLLFVLLVMPPSKVGQCQAVVTPRLLVMPPSKVGQCQAVVTPRLLVMPPSKVGQCQAVVTPRLKGGSMSSCCNTKAARWVNVKLL